MIFFASIIFDYTNVTVCLFMSFFLYREFANHIFFILFKSCRDFHIQRPISEETPTEAGSIGKLLELYQYKLQFMYQQHIDHYISQIIFLRQKLKLLWNYLILQKGPSCLSKQLGFSLPTYILLCQNFQKPESRGKISPWSNLNIQCIAR